MLDIHTRLSQLKRPSLLSKAAQHGSSSYKRDIHLPRILKSDTLPRHASAIMQLFDIEHAMNETRKNHSAHYSPAKHINVLIALLGEAAYMKESGISAFLSAT